MEVTRHERRIQRTSSISRTMSHRRGRRCRCWTGPRSSHRFAALTGYDDAIHETARLTDEKVDLSEEEKEALDRKQQILMERLGDHPALTVTYFVPDAKKSGGAYVTKSGSLKKIDGLERLDDAHGRDENPAG